MKQSLLLLGLILSFVYAGHHSIHKCIHDQIALKMEPSQFQATDLDEIQQDDRKLQSRLPRKMKITYDMSSFNDLPKDPEYQLFTKIVEKAIKISLKYFNELLKIIPKPEGAMKWDKVSKFCMEAEVPQSDRTDDKDSDLHLYVTYTNEPKETFLAWAGYCKNIKGLGATHGQVNFNMGVLIKENYSNPIQFQDLVQTTIHEMLHVLGFSIRDFRNWVDTNRKPYLNATAEYNVRGVPTTFIITPNVQKAVREYYGCSTLPGMPMENQGGAGSAGSHWETSAILDEMMNPASSSTNSIMTIFTIALLRDTGYYTSVNSSMIESSSFGKNKGCDFLMGQCDKANREYCNSGPKMACDFYYHGTSRCSEGNFSDKGCGTWQAYPRQRCFDVKNNMNTDWDQKYFGVNFGYDSKCFISSLQKSKFRYNEDQPLCYQYECSADGSKLLVKVGEQKVLCSQSGQKVEVEGFSGQLTCPDNLQQFCGFKKLCPNHCSSNGYCVNSICICSEGYSGISCSEFK